jgi:hypothetical protein
MPRRNTKQNRSRSGRRNFNSNLTKRLVATQGDGPAYRNQQIAILDIPCLVQSIATNGTGGVTTVLPVNPNALLSSFGTDYGSIFHEYRIRSVDFHIVAMNNALGATLFRFEEKNGASPAFSEMQESTSVLMQNNSANPKSNFHMRWTARDLDDLVFQEISTYNSVCFFKIYTDGTNLISPDSSYLWMIRPVMRIEFRGLGLA